MEAALSLSDSVLLSLGAIVPLRLDSRSERAVI
jgi:hypothetical protein